MEIEVLRYIGAVTREVESRMHEGRPAWIVKASCSYDTEIEDVWDAITNAERLPRWFLPVSGDLRLGGRYQLKGNAGGVITGCEPPRSLDVTWEMGPDVSWVRVRLEALSDGGTRLRLEHIAHPPEEFWKKYGPGAVGVGWDLALMGLGRHIVTGVTIDHNEAEAWSVSEQGKEFARNSSEDWRRAAIAAGVDETTAWEAAANTTAFYTGEAV